MSETIENAVYLSEKRLIDWSQLTPERIQPEIDLALGEAQKEIDAICAVPLSEVDFENTFLALEEAGRQLSRGWGRLGHLDSVRNSEKQREAYNLMLPKVTEFYSRVPLNDQLWRRLKAFAESDAAKELGGIRRRYFEETMLDFRQAGADLPEERKERLRELNSELAAKTQKYSENVLDSTNAYELLVEDEARLEGLPQSAKAAARQSARQKGQGTEEKPVWRFTLQVPSYLPVLKYADDESLRREIWEASTRIGRGEKHDNTELIRDILRLRQEKAEILGKPSFADHVLQRRMAKNGASALQFVEDLHAKTKPAFLAEIDELESFVAEETGQPKDRLQPWSVSYWGEKLRQSRYDFDEEALRPYFAIDQVIDGLFRVAETLFGIRIEKRKGPEKGWHEDVKLYDLLDESGELLGVFYADWHPREDKRGGAWMNYLDTGEPLGDGTRSPHIGLICGNLSEPVDGKPALLLHYEVETIFHEFGHLLHHLLGQVDIRSLNGVNVAWDFVELPSQIMENWCWNRESLDQFARHHETGEPIPEELFQKMLAARNFQSGMAMMRQLSLGKMDLEMHMNPQPYLEGDLDEKVNETIADYRIPLKTETPPITHRFSHLFSSSVGYAAGYYSYKWAEVLDADAFTRFEKEGVFNQQTGREFREKILAMGNSREPMELFVDFMGREPDPKALLRRSGLA